ncbi:hypothetical protein IGI04_028597 [Brassica rapa subsp. trilocularis]|uniref:Uncharacterized protein n=1 Tax=Brassica rapa subsp. trilocularis TaxID=1813537 RepID=A0ABQ7L516_BRACM|nr:hypothetical protein IGI04_028597 [Brassica rapa subsp. trilocularis]
MVFDYAEVSSQFGAVAGSTRLCVYESDFGWGRPVKVDAVSIDGNKISMAERRDESGGIEIGMCMNKAELDIVLALFKNVEVSRVTPAPNSANSLAIPLTFFDIPWLVFNPVKRVFFYRLTESSREHFHSSILPKLKLSLSLVLGSYLPLSGRITSDPNEPKPNIIVSQNDAVSVTVSETDADFSLLSSYGQRPAFELHALIPELPVSDDSAKILSLQITLFPDHGFSIGVSAHHGVLDGKMSTMFVKAWAHLCKQHLEETTVLFSLPETLTPSLDRSLIKDTTGLDEQMINIVRSLKQGKLIGSRSLNSTPASERGDDVVFATLVLSRGDVERLRERVKNESPDPSQLHLSTFVISYAYMWTCLVKARGGNMERSVSFLFVGDFRERLDPPLPATYFGNCMFPAGSYDNTAAEFAGDGGFVAAVEILSGLVKGLSSRKLETIAEEFKISFDCVGVTSQFGTLAGSTRLGVYDSDFGWGRPVKVDVVSIEGNTISMAERRDESGGIELGLCMEKADLDIVLAFVSFHLDLLFRHHQMTIHVVEVSRVTPAPDSDSVLNSANSLTIPLTFFDLPWLVINPAKRLFFYRLTESTREHFHSSILPKLKLSLSLVLRSYLPLAGRLISHPNEPKPSIVVSQNDAVSLTTAETDSDFSLLSSYGQRPAWELHTLIPDLPVSDDSATVLSLQITLFPGQGFSIGVAAHHAVLDGKTSTMFVKAWAHTCKRDNTVVAPLPETLTPSLDRSLIKDTTGLDEQMIKIVRSLNDDGRIVGRRRNLSSIPAWERGDDGVFATLVLSRGDVERLRERVENESSSPSELLHLSTLVVAYAYVWTCLVKARGGDMERPVSLLFVADFRERLDPPLPATYFGNCMFPAGCFNSKTAGDFAGEGGFVAAVEMLSGLVKGLSSRKIETIAEEFKIGFDCVGVTSQLGSLAGSTRLGVYESDFGWGRPVKVDVVSIERNTISMAERRDESGGIELGLCMKKAEMDIVIGLFNSGLQN